MPTHKHNMLDDAKRMTLAEFINDGDFWALGDFGLITTRHLDRLTVEHQKAFKVGTFWNANVLSTYAQWRLHFDVTEGNIRGAIKTLITMKRLSPKMVKPPKPVKTTLDDVIDFLTSNGSGFTEWLKTRPGITPET